jgi:hypothetical protein
VAFRDEHGGSGNGEPAGGGQAGVARSNHHDVGAGGERRGGETFRGPGWKGVPPVGTLIQGIA